MTGARLPARARAALEEGTLCYLAVRRAGRIHLTPVVYALDGGRLWVSTSRTSVKARAWRRDPAAAGLVRSGRHRVSFRGLARTYDALDPLSWPAAAAAGPRLLRAATRFTVRNARFFAGYAVDAGRVPFAWSPPGRVFAAIRIRAGELVSDDGDVAWGEWPGRRRGPDTPTAFAALRRTGPLDARVPMVVRAAVGESGEGALGLAGRGNDPVVLAVRWRRVAPQGAYHAVAAREILRAMGTDRRPAAALTVDHASSWRAAEMVGMMLQGAAEVFDPRRVVRGRRALERDLEAAAGGEPAGPDPVLIRLRPDRLVWWEGWTTGTVKA